MTTTYGNFEAARELFRSAGGSIWSARSKESHGPATACIKLVQLNETMLEDRDTSVAECLLVSAAIQQTMANKSEFWAPVFELGSDGTNAFYVSRLYPRTLQTLIDNHVKLSSAELKTIMLAIVDGLIDIYTAYHRQHGNLKPSNVMLAAKGHISPGGVLLSDPDRTADIVPSMTRAPDTKAMAQILYALVTHKPPSGARMPLPESTAWKQLGTNGMEWFALCQRLLDTFSRQGLPTLESVRMRIAEIQPTRRRIPRLVYAAVLLTAAALAAYQQRDEVIQGWNVTRDAVTALVRKYVHPAVPIVVGKKTANAYPSSAHTPSGIQSSYIQVGTPATSPLSTTQPIIRRGNPVVAQIRSAATPQLHSVLAEQEFQHQRNIFLVNRSASGSANLVEWNAIYRAVQALDLSYPQPEPTSAWPLPLSSELTARRDAELIRAIDALFDQDNADPSAYTTELAAVAQTAAAVTTARAALAGADVSASDLAVKDFKLKLDALESVDADASATFASIQQELGGFVEARTATDRAGLLIAVANDSMPLSVRVRSWFRLSKAGGSPWPSDLATLAADRAQGNRLAELSKDAPATLSQIGAEQQARFDGFFKSLRDPAAVHNAARQGATAKLATLVPLYPEWFQYDVMLAKLQDAPAVELTHAQTASFLDLADKVHASNGPQLRAAFTAVREAPRTLASVGPAGAPGWMLAPGSTSDHRTYLMGSESIEFLRVHQPALNGNAPVDCYLSTTEVPISLLQLLLGKSRASQRLAAIGLNDQPRSAEQSMKIWTFDFDEVKLDDRDYKACFLLAPTTHLPVQAVTPEMAMYVARLLGCRLPTSDEWRGALSQVTQPTADPYQWGFAMRGWKLRDSDFTAAMNRANNAPPPKYWPNQNIFRDPSRLNALKPAEDARTWSSLNLASLAGQIAPVPNLNQPDGDQALPMAAGHLGFREVDDGEHYTGVFHDLIGNAAEFVLDIPPNVSEKLDVSDARRAVEQIKTWFTPEREARVGVIGGSALSPPDLDPRTVYKLPANAPVRCFSDVGFRLAFSDPRSTTSIDPAKLRAAALERAEFVTADVQAHAKQPK